MESRAAASDSRPGSGISAETLIIASLASAGAAFVASRVLGRGTLIAAAFTPVIVALVSEFLRRPVQSVAASARRIPSLQSGPVARKPTVPASEARDRESGRTSVRGERGSRSGRGYARRPVELVATSSREAGWGPINYSDVRRRPRWRLALITGLLGFAIVVALFTVPELVAGRSITGSGRATTFFGGSASASKNTGSTTVTRSAPTTTTTTKATTAATATTTTTTSSAVTSTPRSTTPLTTTSATPTISAATSASPRSAAPPPGAGVTTQTAPAR